MRIGKNITIETIDRLKPEFHFIDSGRDQNYRIIHIASGIEFIYINGAEYTFGLTEDEMVKIHTISGDPYISIGEMRPAKSIFVNDFLVSRHPLTNRNLYMSGFGKIDDSNVALKDVGTFLRISEVFNLDLILEYQLEFLYKKGSSGLFPWGDSVENADIIEPWMKFDVNDAITNDLGISNLFCGEWCRDFYRPNHEEVAALDGADNEARVIKGGGAFFWPWQAEEWVWCLATMRSSSVELPDGEAACRLVYNL